jgi:glycosyltransferase involved in cell wall biosynthesis
VGTPVLTTDATPWRELEAMDCGWIASCAVDSIAANLSRALAASPERRREMGSRGRSYIRRNFSLDTVIEKQIRMYRWLSGGERPSDFIYAG